MGARVGTQAEAVSGVYHVLPAQVTADRSTGMRNLSAVASASQMLQPGVNPVASLEAGTIRAPALFFTVQYPTPIGARRKQLIWTPHLTFKSYMKGAGLTATWLRCRCFDSQTKKPLKLMGKPYPGQLVVLRPGGR